MPAGPGRVLIVDTPVRGLWALAARLRLDGMDVVEVHETASALAQTGPGLGLLVVHCSASADLAAILSNARAIDPDIATFVVVDDAPESTVPAALAGAEVLPLPGDVPRFAGRVARELARVCDRRRLAAFRQAAGPRLTADALIGACDSISRIRSLIPKVAAARTIPVLVAGEWGTGRALMARLLHDTGDRADGPFVRIDCTYREHLPSQLLGTPDGAGALEWSSEGTLYLEHVDRLTPALQTVVLRAVEEGMVRRGAFECATAVRVVASTSVDLAAEVRTGRFRQDLYYRLTVVRFDLPPLRHRDGDVALLASHFAHSVGIEFRQRPAIVSNDAQAALRQHPWPGNVRELRHTIERAVCAATDDTITRAMLGLPGPPSVDFRLPDDGVDLDALERQLVTEALERAAGNQTRAAELLGLHRDQIRYRMAKYGMRR